MMAGAPPIGLRDLVYALVTSDDATSTVYGTVKKVPGIISANINPAYNTGSLASDDQPTDTASSLSGITVTIGHRALPTEDEAALLGKTVDAQGVIVDSVNDNPPDVAIGFRSITSDNKFRYYWLLKGKFHPYQEQLQTKDNSINFQTPSLEGNFVARLSDGKWRYKLNEGDEGANEQLLTKWFDKVYDGTAPTV
jgi:phi13 family phage major tail protein